MKKTASNYRNRVDQVQSARITRSLKQIMADARHDRRSGSGQTKGDVNDTFIKYELKTKEKPSQSITIKKEYYDKVEAECLTNLSMNQIPAVVFAFGDEDDIVSFRARHFYQLFGEFLKWRSENNSK